MSDTTITILINGIVLIPLIIITVIFLMGKGGFLIAGYNTMTKEQQEKYDIKRLCKFMGKVCLVADVYIVILLIATIFNITWLIIAANIMLGIDVIFAVIFANSKRFKKFDK